MCKKLWPWFHMSNTFHLICSIQTVFIVAFLTINQVRWRQVERLPAALLWGNACGCHPSRRRAPELSCWGWRSRWIWPWRSSIHAKVCWYGGFHSHGGTPTWMVYEGKTPLKWMISGYPISGNHHILVRVVRALKIFKDALFACLRWS